MNKWLKQEIFWGFKVLLVGEYRVGFTRAAFTDGDEFLEISENFSKGN